MNETRHTRTVGIVGAGQLARMTIQASIPLGVRVELLAERPDDGAALVSAHVTLGAPSSESALFALANRCDVMTFDHELVPFEYLLRLESEGFRIAPSAATMALAQDKRLQRERFAAAGLAVPAFEVIEAADQLQRFGERHGWPVVLKAARGGYDGRGVWIAGDEHSSLSQASELLGRGVELLAEKFVPIERELAILVARRSSGETAIYSLVETVQVDGMCREIVAPAIVDPLVACEAHRIAGEVARISGVVGILAVELFLTDGKLLINEIATRPHNSGHYSIEGCVTSQFEQHLRAILDWPLGSTALTAPSVVTVNIVGDETGSDPARHLPEVLRIEGAHVHLYGKGPRPGRKLGHVTVCGTDPVQVRARANEAAAMMSGAVPAGVSR